MKSTIVCKKCGDNTYVCQLTHICQECGDRVQIVYRYLPMNELGFYPIVPDNFADISSYYEEHILDCISWPTTMRTFLGWFAATYPHHANDAMVMRKKDLDEHRERWPKMRFGDYFGRYLDRCDGDYIFYDEYHHDDGNPKDRPVLEDVLAEFANCVPYINAMVWAALDNKQQELDQLRAEDS